jgi:hypothetical protein
MKKILALLLFVSTVALAQNYPSPTYKAINGTAQYTPSQFGALCNGSHDDATAINAAITQVQAAGGGRVVFPPGMVCAIGSTLAQTASNVTLECAMHGANVPNNNGPFIFGANGCQLKWIGASAGTMVSIVSPTVNTSSLPLNGNSIIGMTFNGNLGLAADAIFISTLNGGTFKDITAYNFSGSSTIDLNVAHVTNTNFNTGATASSQWNTFDNIQIQNFIGGGGVPSSPSNGINIGAYAGGGALTVNASENIFRNIYMELGAGAAGFVIAGDTNHFQNISVNQFSSTAPSVEFIIRNDGSNFFPGSSNDFHGFVGTNPVLATGQTTYPACTSAYTTYTANTCTNGNSFWEVDDGNGTPSPTIEPGAQLMWRVEAGYSIGQDFGNIAIGDSFANALGAIGAHTTESLHIRNNAGNHIILDNSNGAVGWGITFDGSNNFVVNSLTGGSGEFKLPSTTASSSTSTGALVVAGGVGIAGTLNANALFTGSATVGGGAINSTPIGATTPSTGAFTTLSATGLITPSTTVGIKGTAAADNAQAGSIGVVAGPATASSISLTANTPANIVTLSLPAGDWNVYGIGGMTCAASTTATGDLVGISTTSATLPAFGNYWQWSVGAASAQTNPVFNYATPPVRINVSATTTVYMVEQAAFGTSTCTGQGTIWARTAR